MVWAGWAQFAAGQRYGSPLIAQKGGFDVTPSPEHLLVQVERVYDAPTPERYRILVDRLWPRGVTKERAALDAWVRDLAPSTDLRRWYGHEPSRFEEFARRYRAELAAPEATATLDEIRTTARRRSVALVTATRDVEHSGAVVLQAVLGEVPGPRR